MVCTDRERRLEQAILAARNSDSPRYGEYLTPKQPDSYRPRRSWVNKVLRYLQEAGYNPRVDQSGHRVETHTTVAQVSGAGWRGLEASCQRNRAKLWDPQPKTPRADCFANRGRSDPRPGPDAGAFWISATTVANSGDQDG